VGLFLSALATVLWLLVPALGALMLPRRLKTIGPSLVALALVLLARLAVPFPLRPSPHLSPGLAGVGLASLLLEWLLARRHGSAERRGFDWAEDVLGPIDEELFFRGLLLFPLARAVGTPLALATTSLLFAAAHLGNAVVESRQGTRSLLADLLFGVTAGALARLTGTPLAPALLHIAWNLASGRRAAS
jgi:hypothetical protein